MEKKVRLTVEEILKKKFPYNVRGYDSVKVDEFLDIVMADYQTYHESLDSKDREIAKLESDLSTLRLECEGLKGALAKAREDRRPTETPNNVPSAESLQLLKRLKTLEEFLYAHGYNPNEIVSGLIK